MATKQDLHDTQNSKDADRSHNAPVFDPKHKPTGLKEEALKDWNRRLVGGR